MTLTPGTQATMTAIVRNGGDLVARNVVVALEDNGTPVTRQTLGALGSGAEQSLTFSYTPPQDGKAHTLAVVADPANALIELDETNNRRTYLGIGPDLVVESPRVMYAAGGTSARIVANLGTAPAPVSTLAISRNQTGADPLETVVPSIPAGSSTIVTGTWAIAAVPDGIYPLLLHADSTSAVTETSELNNEAASDARIGPDLALTDYVVATDRRSITVRVENQGIRQASPVPLWLLPSSELSTRPVWEGTSPTLAVGATVTMTIQLAQPAPQSFRLWVDPKDALPEPIEWNNIVVEMEAPSQQRIFLPVVRRKCI